MTDTETTPDGVTTETDDTPDLIPRSEAQRAFDARDAAKQRVRELEAELASSRKSPTPAKPKPKPEAKSSDETPAWAQQILDRQAAIEQQISGKAKAEQRSKVVQTILKRVPEGNRELAALAVDGLVARGELTLDSDDPGATADAAATLLRNQHASLFSASGSTGSAIQLGPDGKIEWGSIRSMAEVPAGAFADMPDEVYQRLSAGAGDGGGLAIRGGR